MVVLPYMCGGIAVGMYVMYNPMVRTTSLQKVTYSVYLYMIVYICT